MNRFRIHARRCLRPLLLLLLLMAGGQGLLALVVNAPSPVAMTAAKNKDVTLSATGGTGAVSFSAVVQAQVGPVGMSVSVSGTTLTITAAGAGTATILVTGTDQALATDTTTISVTVNPVVTVTTIAPVAMTVARAKDVTLSVTGGTGTVSFGAVVQSQGTGVGMAVSVSGTLLTITATGTGTATILVTATDQALATGTTTISVTVNPVVTVTAVAPVAMTIGRNKDVTLSATGGTGAVSFGAVVQSQSAGVGMAVSVSGTLLTIAATGAGTATILVTGTDQALATGTRTISVTVNPVVTVGAIAPVAMTVNHAATVTLGATGGTGAVSFAAVVQTGVGMTASVSGTTLTISATSAGAATILVTGTDQALAIGTTTISVTVNSGITITLVSPTTAPFLASVSTSFVVSVSLAGGTGTKTVTATVDSGAGRGATVSGTNITVAPGTQSNTTFTLHATVTDAAGATLHQDYDVWVRDPLRWTTTPTGIITVVSQGGTNARPGKVACATAGGHDNQTTTVTLTSPTGPLPAFFSVARTDGDTTLTISLTNNPTGMPTATTTYPIRVTVEDKKSTIVADLTLVWFVNQALNATNPGALAYPIANPGYASVLNGVTYLDPSKNVAGVPDLLWATNETALSITCTRIISATAPLAAWSQGQDQLLCRSSQDIFVVGQNMLLGGTTQVATWSFDEGNGRLTITKSASTDGGGIDRVNQLLACVAYTNPAGSFATAVSTPRRIAISVNACTVRGTNLASTAFTRTINFTNQPPVFAPITVEPGGRKALSLSFTPASTDMACSVNTPRDTASIGRLINAAGTTVNAFSLNEVIQGSIFYANRDGGESIDPITLTVTDNGSSTVLSDSVIVPITLAIGAGLNFIGDPLLFAVPIDGGTTTWTAVLTGPSGIDATISVIPWIGDNSPTIPGVSSSVATLHLGGNPDVPIVINWNTIGGGTNTYPKFLRFRVRARTTDATVEQPCLVRILGPTVPRSASLQASN